ncbi:hypothetical protein FPE01S_01_19000 [Flavihumibacter petaseus NBRC 106054]|uniref:YkuD domain-containing protein n=2 Tax=Flavihumibacter TaxID=1004301 RepID=A0A0E9MYU2_9BACT|nr:hypothetical protein FPE01S_01_19000 [Flavihumibacter petaseus NBRC 106054]
MAYFSPYVMFSSNPAEQSRMDLSKAQGLLNYEKSSIPGLEVKTPAKIAIVNKVAVAKMKKAPKKERVLPVTPLNDNAELLASNQNPSRKNKSAKNAQQESVVSEDQLDDLDNNQSDINPSQPLVNMPKPGSTKEHPGRTVINYSSNDYAEHTSNKRFPHNNEEEEALVLRDESVNLVADKAEKTYTFRGKTTVKSSLMKYIPPFWDGFSEETGQNKADHAELLQKARKIAKFAEKNGCNSDFAFLLDMSVKSNKNRFFVINLRTNTIEMSALVAQGRGNQRLNLDKDYSNRPGSNCSSLGMYKIGKPYDGDFGRSYRLAGLDATNKNAAARAIVLHAMGSIPNMETNFPIWQSEGCPSVSPAVLEKIGNMIDGSKKPVLMWMFDDTYIDAGKSVASAYAGS